MKFVSIIQHTQSEWLGAIEDHLEGRGIRFGYFRPFAAGGGLPEIATLGDGLILVGGGPYGTASADHRLPWLEREERLVRACLMLSKPVLALGLGAQVLALAAEGASAPAPLRVEVTTSRRRITDAIGGLLPDEIPSIIYTRDRPVPPDYARTLAVDAAGEASLFQIGSNAFGATFHPGIRRAMIEDLVMEGGETPDGVAEALTQMASLGSAIEDALVPLMAGLVRACGWDAPA